MPQSETRPLTAAAAGLLAAAIIAACGNPAAGGGSSPSQLAASWRTTATTTTTTTTTTATATDRLTAVPTTSYPAPPTSPPTRTTPHGGRPSPVVVLDPGHNGGSAAHPDVINKPVPAGRGRTKACNTTGTSTDAGYPEHAFNWDVAARVRDVLAAGGVTVVMTRQNDTGVGPCVNERAEVGNQAGAAAVVSIHADGSTRGDARGFHVAYADPPLNAAQGEPSHSLATTLRDALAEQKFPTANYIGTNGLFPRDDLAGLNLSQRPAVLVECGNMRGAEEAAVLSSSDGRQRYAAAIANGILRYLTRSGVVYP